MRRTRDGSARTTSSDGDSEVFWPVAHANQLGSKPLGVVCGREEIVLFRDAAGAVRAMEDRCAHRRARLSMGWLTPDGRLQCRYHGWCYDATSGQCVEIPNHQRDEPPPRYAVRVFEAREAGGFIFVAPKPTPSEPQTWRKPGPALREGALTLPTKHETVVELLIDHPQALLRLDGLFFDLITDPEPRTVFVDDQGLVVAERYAHRRMRGGAFINRRSALLLRTETQQISGLTRITLRQDGGPVELDMVVAAVPAPPFATKLLWRVFTARGVTRAVVGGWRLAARKGEPIGLELAYAQRPDGAAGLVTVPSQTWRRVSTRGAQPDR